MTWVDPDSGFEQQVEYVSDEDAIASTGSSRPEWRRSVAQAAAKQIERKWLLQQEQTNSDRHFQGWPDSAVVRPGQIIKVMDREGWHPQGWAIGSATTTVLTIDNAMTVAENDNVSVVLPDGSVEQRTISEASTGTTITVGLPWPDTGSSDRFCCRVVNP